MLWTNSRTLADWVAGVVLLLVVLILAIYKVVEPCRELWCCFVHPSILNTFFWDICHVTFSVGMWNNHMNRTPFWLLYTLSMFFVRHWNINSIMTQAVMNLFIGWCAMTTCMTSLRCILDNPLLTTPTAIGRCVGVIHIAFVRAKGEVITAKMLLSIQAQSACIISILQKWGESFIGSGPFIVGL